MNNTYSYTKCNITLYELIKFSNCNKNKRKIAREKV